MDTKSIRAASADDLPGIVEIYNETIPGRSSTADLDLVSVEQRRPWFEHREVTRRPVWVIGAPVEAWLSFDDFKARGAYAATAELSIYVRAEQRGRGLGRELLDRALGAAPAFGIANLLAVVFAHNAVSIGLFATAGFAQWGKLPGVCVLDGRLADVLILGRKV